MQFAILILFILVSNVSSFIFKQHSCECSKESLEKTVYPNFTCNPSKINKPGDSISAHFTFRKPINKLWVSGTLENKIRGKFQLMMTYEKKEVCKAIASVSTSTNPVFIMTYKTLKEAIPDFVHECPYTTVDIKNASFNTKYLPKFMLRGEYRTKIKTSISDNVEDWCIVTSVVNMEE
ncbi:hypothetical protein PVAND_000485 [Polypedilum vanderplanki]|uniref:MD-2-related lipid-recognition domain-containing protein n=1 Tax=Polypedilum vanderplanki TaxID=319348 RepID=A0A9J6BKR6_POLVA|nr:hypothetical protein PVAND_000485 [Polypedilum vanderplanki]